MRCRARPAFARVSCIVYPAASLEDVTIDDFFPVKYSQCAFASSGKKTEAWVQALETLGSSHALCT